ncbi:MAG TPA: hypothetical protein VFU80_02275 [Sphingomicrobium sp.]|nr:hypothetical protein [Sphingomicrobium sp.]
MSDRSRSVAAHSNEDEGFVRDFRQRAIEAYDSARENGLGSTRNAIEQAPLVALGAGIAVGALLAALIPTGRRERDLLGRYGTRVTDAARDAADAARTAGTEKLRELGLTADSVAEKASEAAKASAQAAVGRFRD